MKKISDNSVARRVFVVAINTLVRLLVGVIDNAKLRIRFAWIVTKRDLGNVLVLVAPSQTLDSGPRNHDSTGRQNADVTAFVGEK